MPVQNGEPTEVEISDLAHTIRTTALALNDAVMHAATLGLKVDLNVLPISTMGIGEHPMLQVAVYRRL